MITDAIAAEKDAPDTASKKFLTWIPAQNKFFSGREKDLTRLHYHLNHNKISVITGVHGVGKSSLALEYLYRNQDKYDYSAYVELGYDCVLSFMNSFYSNDKLYSSSFSKLKHKLSSLFGRKLLILDSLKIAADYAICSNISNCHIIITTSTRIPTKHTFYLKNLLVADAKQVFNSYYPSNNYNSKHIAILIKYFNYNSFFIQLTAKYLSLRSKEFADLITQIRKNKVKNLFVPNKTKLNQYLYNLLIRLKLSTTELNLLQKMALFSTIALTQSQLTQYLEIPKAAQTSFFAALTNLTAKGLLINYGDSFGKKKYKIHSSLKCFIHSSSYKPKDYQIAQVIVYFIGALHKNITPITQDALHGTCNAIALLAQLAPHRAKLLVNLQRSVASVYTKLNDKHSLNKALQHQYQTLKIDLKTCGKDYNQIAVDYNDLANIHQALGTLKDLKLALFFQRKSLSLDKKSTKATDLDFAVSYNNISMIYRAMGGTKNLAMALKYQKHALQLKQNYFDEEHVSLISNYSNLVAIFTGLRGMGNIASAIEYLHKVISIQEQKLDKNSSILSKNYADIAFKYSCLSDEQSLQLALKYQQQAVAIQEKLIPHHTNIAPYYSNLATIYRRLGGKNNLTHALKMQQQAIAVQHDCRDKDTIQLSLSYSNIAIIYRGLGGKENLALDYQKKAILIQQKDHEPNTSYLSLSYTNLAGVYKDIGDKELLHLALDYQRQAIKMQQQVFRPNDLSLAASYANLAQIHIKLHTIRSSEADIVLALSCLQKTVKIQRYNWGNNHLDLAKSYNDIVSVLQEMGDNASLKQAIKYKHLVLDIYINIHQNENPFLPQLYLDLVDMYTHLGGEYNDRQALKYVEYAQKYKTP